MQKGRQKITRHLSLFREDNPQDNPLSVIGDGFAYDFMYIPNKNITFVCAPKKQLDDYSVDVQATFGFNDPKLLRNFYDFANPMKYFRKTLRKQFQDTKALLFWKDRSYEPFSDYSRNYFDAFWAVNAGGISLTDYIETIDNIYCIEEFIRLQLAFSKTAIETQSKYRVGYKETMKIMSRTSIKSCWLKKLPQLDWKNFNLMLRVLAQITNHMLPDQDSKPFSVYQPAFNATEASPPVTLEEKLISFMAKNSYLTAAFAENMTTMNAIESIFSTKITTESAKKLIDALSQIMTMDEIVGSTQIGEMERLIKLKVKMERLIKKVKNNIKTYDYLSPPPYSSPEDPLGLYSRKDPAINNLPEFLFEIRYADKFFQSSKYKDMKSQLELWLNKAFSSPSFS